MGKGTEPKIRKTDRRTLYTKNVIKDSLLEALAEKSFDQITVTDICRRAEITRATYYLHYQSLTQVLNELLEDALQMTAKDSKTQDDDALQILSLLAKEQPEHLKEQESLLPICHRVAHLPKYQVIFYDETLSNYVVNRIFQYQRKKLTPDFMRVLNLSQKEAELLLLFIITGTYNVNKALNWKKNDTWYKAACRKTCCGNQAKAGFLFVRKNVNEKSIEMRGVVSANLVRFPPSGAGWRAFHFQVASFFRFMAANLSFTQFVTWAKPLYCV